jgi:hypothetical protein
MLPQKFDTTIAHKMINLTPELTGTDKRIAAAIIEHFNRKTAQCDPGLSRIAWLVGVSRRTAIRSVSHIVATGILRVVRHGGYSQRNSYEPVWSRFRELDAVWKTRFRAKSRGADGSRMSPSTCQACHHPSDQPVTQTSLINQSKETRTNGSAFAQSGPPSALPSRKESPRKNNSQASYEFRITRISRSVRSADAMCAAAERRWNAALHDRFAATPDVFGQVVEAIDAAMQSAATEAEMRRPGAGLAHILHQIQAMNMPHPVQSDRTAGPAQPPVRNP